VAPGLVTQSAVNLIQDRLGLAGTGASAAPRLGERSGHGLEIAALDETSDTQLAKPVAAPAPGSPSGPRLWQLCHRRQLHYRAGLQRDHRRGARRRRLRARRRRAGGRGLRLIPSTSLTFNAAFGSAHIDNFMVVPYGRYTEGDWYVSGVGPWASPTSPPTAWPAAPLSTTASANPGGEVYGLYGETGYHVHTSFARRATTLTPLAGLGYTRFTTDGFTESGAGIADATVQAIHRQSREFAGCPSLRALRDRRPLRRLGPRGARDLAPRVPGRPGHLTPISRGTPSFTALGTTPAPIPPVGRQLTQELNPAAKLFLNYDAELQSGLTQHTVSRGVAGEVLALGIDIVISNY